ncbi:rod shape determining protein RodA [Mobilisporobacter senegalensis]|uniref:Rod shape determining protein RodA n=1 Tax=Mobilisporobacter senegalensis TaxID=1329262 RepID=A0A3N1XR82_9FIRM|nr:FtsW/RodA/SpoVE family cell cycle protein [Mobilisporobacter senegalensis]ROR29146.1 rod shape determining protein RodA [Mobilisporobacter senegalensis]
MFNFKQYNWKNFNFPLVTIILILSVISVIMVGFVEGDSKSLKHILGIIFGIFLMLGVALVDYHFLCRLMWVFYGINLILLLLVKFSPLGKEQFSSKRWLDLKVFDLQPSELTKIFMIIFLAQLFTIMREKLDKVSTAVIALILMGIPTFLILIQTNLSTSLVLMFIFLVMIYTAGLDYKIIIPTLAVGIPVSVAMLWYIQQPFQKILQPYQQRRVLSILHPELYPDAMYQQNNSVQAIGSGQLYGKLLFDNGTEIRGSKYVAVAESDFIFSVIGEELGFIGSCLVIGLLVLLVIQCINTARRANDYTGMLVAVGLSSMFAFQVFVNIGVATSILPNTGLPLPFLSYGLSSLMSSMMGIGLILNIGLQRKNYRR